VAEETVEHWVPSVIDRKRIDVDIYGDVNCKFHGLRYVDGDGDGDGDILWCVSKMLT
jgi:hypothetical protein